jgi:hypothetical protein
MIDRDESLQCFGIDPTVHCALPCFRHNLLSVYHAVSTVVNDLIPGRKYLLAFALERYRNEVWTFWSLLMDMSFFDVREELDFLWLLPFDALLRNWLGGRFESCELSRIHTVWGLLKMEKEQTTDKECSEDRI